jgi:polysaccharide biosynthesis protein PelD
MLKDLPEASAKRKAGQNRPLFGQFIVAWEALRGLAAFTQSALQDWIHHHPGLPVQLAETVLWPLLVVYLAWASNPSNPLYINDGFPWPWLGPWLIALRYGVGYGVVATFGLLGSWSWLTASSEFPRLYFLGGAIAMLMAGEFGSYWRRRLLQLEQSLQFFKDKIERLTRRLYLIKLSHDELEYEMVARPGTLREALIDLRVLVNRYAREHPGDLSGLPGAQIMLDFVVNHCRIESAALYQVQMEPMLKLKQVAAVGRPVELEINDPMILLALETKHQVHLQDALLQTSRRSDLIAATPLVNIALKPIGLMVITNMPFTALNADNLQKVAVLLESYADYLRLLMGASALLPVWPEAPPGMLSDFAWLTRLRLDHGLESRCMVWHVRHVRENEILAEILALHTRGETAWRWPVDQARLHQSSCVIALIPFSGASGVLVYRQRLLDAIGQKFGEIGPKQLYGVDFDLCDDHSIVRLRALVEGKE